MDHAQDREYREWLLTEYIPIGGGSGEGEVTGDSVGLESDPNAVAAPSANAEGTPAQGQESSQAAQEQAVVDALLELDGQRFTEAEIREAIQAKQNEKKWRGELSKRGEEVNAAMRAIEQARLAMLQQHPNQYQQPVQGQQPQQPQSGVQGIPTEQLIALGQKAFLEGDAGAITQLMGYIENLASQKASATVGTVTEQQQIRQKFLSEYPDFEQTVQTPEFQEFAFKQGPGFNVVNSYFAYQLQQARNAAEEAKRQIEDAKKAGFTQGEQSTIKNLQAKSGLKVLKGGTAAPTAAPPDIAGMSKHDVILEATRRIMEARQNGG